MEKKLSRWELGEKSVLVRALGWNSWNIAATAKWLGIARWTCYRKIESLGIKRERRAKVFRLRSAIEFLGVKISSRQFNHKRLTELQRLDLVAACKAGFRSKCKSNHPDVGGTQDQFTKLCEAWKTVKRRLGVE